MVKHFQQTRYRLHFRSNRQLLNASPTNTTYFCIVFADFRFCISKFFLFVRVVMVSRHLMWFQTIYLRLFWCVVYLISQLGLFQKANQKYWLRFICFFFRYNNCSLQNNVIAISAKKKEKKKRIANLVKSDLVHHNCHNIYESVITEHAQDHQPSQWDILFLSKRIPIKCKNVGNVSFTWSLHRSGT